MDKMMSKMMWSAAVVAGLGTLGAVGMMSMQNGSKISSHRSRGMMSSMTDMREELADELCSMAHKTGNAMIRAGRLINRMVP